MRIPPNYIGKVIETAAATHALTVSQVTGAGAAKDEERARALIVWALREAGVDWRYIALHLGREASPALIALHRMMERGLRARSTWAVDGASAIEMMAMERAHA